MKKMICPRDCAQRSVEPSCRATCERWKEHEKDVARQREEKELAIAQTYYSENASQRMKINAMRRKRGRP